jgi:hypothetical protein
MEQNEKFVFGEVVTTPIFKWKHLSNENFLMTGWECDIETNTGSDGEQRIYTVQLCYDFIKWDIVKLGDMVKLSIQGKILSKTSMTGESIKCNVVKRK